MCQWLKELCPQIKAHGGFKGAAKFLRMSASQLEYEALREFESFKTSFGSTSRPVRFEIYGGSPDENRQIPIRIDRCVSKAYMTGFFGACVDRIIQMVNGQVSDSGRTQVSTRTAHSVCESAEQLRSLSLQLVGSE